MTRSLDLTRRFLLGASAAGVSLAFAGQAGASAAPGPRNKMVVIIARGAMDGLSVVVPVDDPNYRPLRGALAIEHSLPMSDGFGLHPSLAGLHSLYSEGQMRFAPAVAIPVRVRSHFDAQDVLENGGEGLRQQTDGWLNRALAAMGGLKGLSIGAQTPLILRGSAATSSWAPGGRTGSEDRIASLLQDLYVNDRLLAENLAAGLQTEAQAMAMGGDPRLARNDVAGLGQAVARLMTGPDGADVVALSVDGWDTHARQVGQLQARLTGLDQVVSGLRSGLGEDWDRTVVVIATEFGRTARANGTGGTDHGTGSALLMAGGAVKAGGMIGDWPTLADNRLFESRDLAPALDVRSVFKGVLRDHLGVDKAALDSSVFPASADEAPALNGLF
ncbi:DUF1501 domain-containing protein [Brevundimonas variabilis]|uniref:Uncharacterized protein (DUF1501 family) n=1 Tax=Brevundimonas variabilis TaxID=74312 RepID=A0A7W9CFS7_9CAUL|nr:DUF1501 domain-containing protein [Brevundimonas variabilis]MBB5744817.1 uncharacterized protein (DUF1501 family) [Brevundimonas variabilis]